MIACGACLCISSTHAADATAPLPGKMQLELEEPKSDDWSFSLSTGWTSKYITEGVDCAPGTSIWESTPSVSWRNFTLSAWHALGVDDRYEELDLVLSYDWKIGPFTIRPWYEHQIYISPKDEIPNPAITMTYDVNDWLVAGVDLQWKILNRKWKGYYDVFLQSEWKIAEKWSLTPMIRFGYNDGYNTMANRGANSIDYSLKLTYSFNQTISASAFVFYSEAATVLRRVDLGDECAYGFSLNISF